jgi:hypothetical protein
MTLTVRKMRANDDAFAVASMMVGSGFHNNPFGFRDDSEAMDLLPKALLTTDTEYSYRNCWLCFDGNLLAGFLLGYEPTNIDIRTAKNEYSKAFAKRRFVSSYTEWRKYSAPLRDIGAVALIHDMGFTAGYCLNDAGTTLVSHFCEAMNDLNYNSVYMDYAAQDTDGIETLKKIGFSPIRFICGNEHVSGYVRLICNLSKNMTYISDRSTDRHATR